MGWKEKWGMGEGANKKRKNGEKYLPTWTACDRVSY